METVLAEIVADKKIWVAARKEAQPLASFQDEITPSDRDMYAALGESQTSFILECKKASPSKGLIRDHFDLDYIAGIYGRYATAISVLTDEKYFQGDFEFINQVRSQVNVPVICKDFMVDPYQVYLARYYQADAILLMLSVLDDQQYRELFDLAHSLNLNVLTEVSNQEELERAIALKAPLVGINNRNLRDLSVDLNRTKELAPQLPEGVIVISESGINNHQQVRDIAQFANGFLIGSSLMGEQDLERAVRRVLLGDNKVCGLTRPEDAITAYQAGANYGGLIFVPQSKRVISVNQAKEIKAAAPLSYVGVFQNQEINEVSQIAAALNLNVIQLHGDEDQQYIDQLRDLLPKSTEIWKALAVSKQLPEFNYQQVDRYLLDSKVTQVIDNKTVTQTGGTGEVFDWQLISEENKKQIMLAGGISPENAKQASQLACLGLDINSGAESAPGIKESEKLTQIFSQIRAY
ncbi:bifunctional indole-3-glycerol-phosphate synthase TrpC/phosphoribosylanthranilate isomerase TrpF [Vibrio sp. SS-MA-C1-2]|uniref:bifunctional indole-3-glycerol-phosphate synthase TrpC/phosphoribosylanthranilate isomerase TrpF n=1 Tax=Vibrio sp. SS-MA-C1-2 TaxID=2908646 RepID=UPI001F2F3EED|nr:bifunctional indole-3-glycerol-phosphate synthase TrpC/phosphoribosylanthranilate isomerase TrpF [Vibrio sp. SS-MA-C1-2]UJF19821.1 bifunctional indole-3-glycerol-phosphate synthase TrpC/phosphoribosylanthranilate isomerase TrpF [Vibrio sp. SS-MA-C1-2]